MDCKELVELVTAYLDEALDSATRERFAEHMATCTGCDAFVEQFRETIAAVGELKPEHLSWAARSRLLDAFREWHAH